MYSEKIKREVRKLRSEGKTYTEISQSIPSDIPKSTLTGWCEEVDLPESYFTKIKKLATVNIKNARILALESKKEHRSLYLKTIVKESRRVLEVVSDNESVKKIVLSVLYLAEGSKSPRGAIMFGNSDPHIVRMFVNLLRECYKVDESKFRCTVQCRADQDVKALEIFWVHTTKIPLTQFYKARIDKRTIGQKSKKVDYKGVCRIDYFSSAIDLELKCIGQTLARS